MITKKGDIVHLRIKRKAGGFKLFIKKHGKSTVIDEQGGLENLIHAAKTALGLTKPCLGRKYKDIFKKKKGVYMMNDYSASDEED